MNRPLKIIFFFIVLILGSFCLYAISPLVTFFAVSLTGWGWLFVGMRWIMLLIFWAVMFRKFWPEKRL